MAITTLTRQPAVRRLERKLSPFPSIVALAGLLTSSAGNAAEWRVTPFFGLQQIFTDNVRLAPAGAEQSDFIFGISPGIGIRSESKRLRLEGSYALQHLRYASDDRNSSTFHILDGKTRAELVDDLVWIDGNASIGQQTIALQGARPTNNYSVSSNRSTVKTYNVSPFLRHDYQDFATTELRYTHASVDAGTENLSSNEIDRFFASINSGTAFRVVGWGVDYSVQQTEATRANSYDSASIGGRLRYKVTPQFYLTASGGHEKFDYQATNGEAPEGAFYTGGFSWRPTERTTLDASAGRRFYGNTFAVSSSLRRRHSIWRLSYDEAVTTTADQFAAGATGSTASFVNELYRSSIPDDALRQEAVDRFILNTGLPSTLTSSINYFTTRVFLQKALRGSVAMTGSKSTVLLTAFRVDRETVSSDDGLSPELNAALFANPGNTRQTGASVVWNWRLSSVASTTLGIDSIQSKTDLSNRDNRLRAYRAAYSRRFNTDVSGVVELRHTNQAADIGRDYRENAISAFLTMKF